MPTKDAPVPARLVEENLRSKGIYPDRIFRRGSRYIARFTFFYTHGKSPDYWRKKFERAGFKVITCSEVWNPWPKDSYWEVQF